MTTADPNNEIDNGVEGFNLFDFLTGGEVKTNNNVSINIDPISIIASATGIAVLIVIILLIKNKLSND